MTTFLRAKVLVPSGIAVASLGTVVYVWAHSRRGGAELYNEPYIKEACRLFMKNSPAVDLVGLPVDFKRIHVDHKFNTIKPLHSQVVIPISGSKLNGEIFVWASKLDPNYEPPKVEDAELDEAIRMKPEDREKWILERFGRKRTGEEMERRRRAWRVTRVEAKFGGWDQKFLIFDDTTERHDHTTTDDRQTTLHTIDR